ncbi:MAG: hypothetical protein HKN18_18000 [Silicimonas sp.]|nr:hypothetical protein [Silicimonas sp.]
MSNQDSFIDEVTDEVRRDRLFALMRRYGWIAILVVIVVVGGAAFNEWRKAAARAEAEAAGEALLGALSEETAEARATALAALPVADTGEKRAIAALLLSAAEAEAGEDAKALATLETLAGDPETPVIYRDLAILKRVMLGQDIPPEDRIAALQPLMQPGNPFRLLAIEQRALAEIELGQTDTAIETLTDILADADRTEGLRRRVSQLIVALGGSLEQG